MVTDADDCNSGVLAIGRMAANMPGSQRPRVFRGARPTDAAASPTAGSAEPAEPAAPPLTGRQFRAELAGTVNP